MKILLDCDGILADFVGATLEIVQFQMGLQHTPEQVTGCDIPKALGLDNWNTAYLYRKWRSDGFANSLEPYHGAKKFVRELRKCGRVIVVTTPMEQSPTWLWERTGWLYRHFGLSEIEFTNRKDKVPGDVLIEDHPENLRAFPGRKILLDRPWNRGADLPRVYSYSEILGAL